MRAAPEPVLVAWSVRAAPAAATAAAVLGAIGLVGSMTGASALVALIPGRPVMTPNTSVGLILLAVGVHLLAPAAGGRGRRAGGQACALVVLAVALATLANAAVGVELVIDRVLPTLLPEAAAGLRPLRSAVPTAVCLTLLATGLLLFDAGRRPGSRPAQVPVLAAAVVIHAVLTGHAYEAERLYQSLPTPLMGTSLPTGLGLGLLVVAVLFSRPERGVMGTITSSRVGGAMARRMLLPAIAGPPLLGFVVLMAARVDSDLMALTHALLATASATVAAGLTLLTAASLDRLDEVRERVSDELRLWRDVVDQAEDAIVVKSHDHVVIGWNPAAERLFGWTREEMVGRSMLAVVPEDRRRELETIAERLGRGERVSGYETVQLDKSGAPIEVGMSLANFTDSAGRQIGMAAIVRDLRERKVAERRYADLFEHASDAIFVADAGGRIEEVNAAACRLLGRASGDVVGRAIADLVAPEDVERLLATREALLRGEVAVGDWQLLAGDGATIPVEASATIRDGRWQLFVRDLRARRAAEAELARLYREEALAKAWLQGVIDGMPEAVLLADAHGRLSHNTAARRFVAGGEGHGFDLRQPDGAPVAWAEVPLMRALRTGETSNGLELMAHDAQDGRVPVLVSASPLLDASGRRVGAVSVLRDISVLKEMERLREEWTAIVAHDLRQPLSVISLSTHALGRALQAAPGSSAATSLTRIRGAIERLGRMVRDLLDAARIDARRLTLERVPVDLRALLSEVVARTSAGTGRAIVVDLPPALPRVLADPCRVEQVMDNLLSNALKYGAPDSEIVVAAREREGAVMVSTTNRGAALTPEDIARLFNRFYRARVEQAVEGLGLGLYITQGLVEAHGGRVWAESEDQTTTFRFTLPLA